MPILLCLRAYTSIALNAWDMVHNAFLQMKIRPHGVIHGTVTALTQDVNAYDCRQRTSCCNPTSCSDRSLTECVRSPEATVRKVGTVRIYHSATSIKKSDREIWTRCSVRHRWPANRQILFLECGMWRLNEACWISLRSWEVFS